MGEAWQKECPPATREPLGLGSDVVGCCTHREAGLSLSIGSHTGGSQPVEITVEWHEEITQANDFGPLLLGQN